MSRFFSTGVSPVQFADAERSNFKSRTTIQSDGVELQLSLMDMDGRFTNEQKLERARKAMTAQAQRKLDMIGKISKALGMDVVVHDYMRGSNGYFGEDGKIHFVLSGHMSVARVAAHELTHQMQSVASEKYTVVRDQLIEDVGQDRFDRLLKRKAAQYGYNMESEQGRLACDEEVIAELCEGMLSDKDRLERFAERHTDTALTLKDRLTKILNAIHATLKDTFGQNQNRISDMITDEKTADKWLDGLDEVLKRVQEKQQAKEVKYSIETDGPYSYVKADRQVFTSSNIDTRKVQLENYLNSIIDYTGRLEIPTMDGEVIAITDASTGRTNSVGKLSSYNEHVNKETGEVNAKKIRLKQNIALHIDEVIAVSQKAEGIGTVTDRNFKHDAASQKGWTYRNAYFEDFDGKKYAFLISVPENDTGKFVYNVNKFRERNFETKRPSSEKITGISLSGAQTEESLNSYYAQNKESVKGKFSLDTDSGNLQAELYELKNQRKEMLEADEAYRKASEQRRYANTFAERVAASRALREAQEKIDTAEIDRKISELQDRISKMREEEVRKHREEKEKYAGTKTAGYSMEPDTRLKSLDAPYMEAVKIGNKSKAQKLVQQAAEAAMPKSVVRDSKGKLLKTYHYTNSNFTAFDRSTARTGNEMDGFFFAPDAESTREYGERQIVAYLNITNLAVDPVLDRKFDDSGTLLREKLAAQGYDGVARTENGKIYEYMVFDPEQIKLADAVTYDDAGNAIPLSERFNMGKKDIRYALDEDYKQYVATTESQQFKRWFGDSKVVNADGTPMKVYHQTENDFTVFDPRKGGAGSRDDGTPFGIFLKSSPRDIGLKGKKQMELYVSIENPLRAANREDFSAKMRKMSPEYDTLIKEHEALDAEYKAKNREAKDALVDFMVQWRKDNPGADSRALYEVEKFNELFDAEDTLLDEWTAKADAISVKAKEALTSALEKNGYDGVILETDEGSWGRKTDAYIALRPEQVKSATDNIGTFDRNNPDIRYSLDTEQLEKTVRAIDTKALEEGLQSMTLTSNVNSFTMKDPSRFFDAISKNNTELRDELHDIFEKPHSEATGLYARNLEKMQERVKNIAKEAGVISQDGKKFDKAASAAVQNIGEGIAPIACSVEAKVVEADTIFLKATRNDSEILSGNCTLEAQFFGIWKRLVERQSSIKPLTWERLLPGYRRIL